MIGIPRKIWKISGLRNNEEMLCRKGGGGIGIGRRIVTYLFKYIYCCNLLLWHPHLLVTYHISGEDRSRHIHWVEISYWLVMWGNYLFTNNSHFISSRHQGTNYSNLTRIHPYWLSLSLMVMTRSSEKHDRYWLEGKNPLPVPKHYIF